MPQARIRAGAVPIVRAHHHAHLWVAPERCRALTLIQLWVRFACMSLRWHCRSAAQQQQCPAQHKEPRRAHQPAGESKTAYMGAEHLL